MDVAHSRARVTLTNISLEAMAYSARKEANLWPAEVNLAEGFSSALIDLLNNRSKLSTISSKTFVPTLASYWPLGLYSNGVYLRNWLRWSSWFPVPAFSDHGVQLSSHLLQAEEKSHAKYHLTWSEWRMEAGLEQGKSMRRIPHPSAILLQRNPRVVHEIGSRGALYFVPHSLPGHHSQPEDYQARIREIEKAIGLPVVALCVAMHDAQAGLHYRLKRLGLPIVTAGHTGSDLFLSRLVTLISYFGATCSNDLGTHSYISEVVGRPFFLAGRKTVFPRLLVFQAREGADGYRRRQEHEDFFMRRSQQNPHGVAEILESTFGLSRLAPKYGEDLRKELLRQVPGILLALQETVKKRTRRLAPAHKSK